MKRVLLFVAVFSVVLVPTRTHSAPSIRPGDYMESSVAGCTLGFVAVGDRKTYFMTAAHCVNKTGDDIRLEDGRVFADMVVKGSASNPADDWALLRVRSAYVSRVNPAPRGLGGTPTGVAAPWETSQFDEIQFSGHGIPWFVHPFTRENRIGVLGYHDKHIYDAIGMDTNGDSGGPIIHAESGQALGLVSRLCIGVCTSEGPTVQGILSKAAAKGFAISLKLA